MLIALLSALTGSGNILIDKFLLAKRKMGLSIYIPLTFVFLFLWALISLPWFGSLNTVLIGNRQYLFYFVLMIILALLWNMLYYEGLQKEKMIEFELIMLATPLVTIFLSAFFFPEEFNLPIFLSALIGSLAFILSHLKKHHFAFDKYTVHLLFAVVLIAMEAMVQKELLSIYSPALLYALRTAVLSLFFWLYYRPNMHKMGNADFQLAFISGFLGTVSMVTKFYGYEYIGVTMTTLILLLMPILVSWYDAKINKTPIRRQTVLAFVIIVLCVVYATMNVVG